MIQKIAVLVHGKDGSPTTSWLPWLKSKMEVKGYRCEVPMFPPQDDSRLADWFSVFDNLELDLPNTIFVAHARGAMALLRWVNRLPADTRIHQIITVSCNFDYQPNRTDGDEFYLSKLDYVDLRRKCQQFVVIHSEDDPYVAVRAGEELSAQLGAKFARYPTAGHFGSEKLEAPEILRELLEAQQLKIKTQGFKLAALFDAPKSEGNHPLVLLLHGNTGWKEEEHLASLAQELAANGIAALRFDAPATGESDGTWEEDYRVSNYLEVTKDVHRYALEHLPIDKTRIALWGHSMGGLVAITAAERIPGIVAVCGSEPASGQSESSTPSVVEAWRKTGWREVETEIFGTIRLPFAFYADRDKFDALRSIKNIQVPILLISGTSDEAVSAISVRKLFAAARKPKTYLEFPIGHEYKYDPDGLQQVNAATVEFFKKHLVD